MKLLICNCCGKYTHGKQWWNRDTGFGECKSCVEWKLEEKRETKEGIELSSGKIGIYCGID